MEQGQHGGTSQHDVTHGRSSVVFALGRACVVDLVTDGEVHEGGGANACVGSSRALVYIEAYVRLFVWS